MQWTLLVVAGLGTAHFAMSLLIWMLAIFMLGRPASAATWLLAAEMAWPVPLLLLGFAWCLRRSWRRRPRVALILAMSLCGALSLLAFDLNFHRWQIQEMEVGRGCRHYYFTWFWYDA